MCFGKTKKAETPAAAPEAALPPPEAPEIAEARRKESMNLYGQDTPNYRVKRRERSDSLNPSSDIVM